MERFISAAEINGLRAASHRWVESQTVLTDEQTPFCFWQFMDNNQNIQHHHFHPSAIFSFHSLNYRQMMLASRHPCHGVSSVPWFYVLVYFMARFPSPSWFTVSPLHFLLYYVARSSRFSFYASCLCSFLSTDCPRLVSPVCWLPSLCVHCPSLAWSVHPVIHLPSSSAKPGT